MLELVEPAAFIHVSILIVVDAITPVIVVEKTCENISVEESQMAFDLVIITPETLID